MHNTVNAQSVDISALNAQIISIQASLERPNDTLRNENMMHVALSKYNRLKIQGVTVDSWLIFWNRYKEENLVSLMYEFAE